MAVGNYGLVVDTSNFKPFTFQDIIAPFLLYKQDYEKMGEKMEKYEEDFGKLALPEDSQYYNTLDQWKQDYDKASNLYLTEGLANSGKQLRELFKRAKRDIAPIREATIARNKVVDDINKMRASHPGLIYDANDLNIDKFMGGNTPNVRIYNGEAIEQDAANTITAYAKANPADPTIENLRTGYIYAKQQGLKDKAAFEQAINSLRQQGVDASNNDYMRLLQNVVNKYDTEESETLRNDVLNRVISGAIKGMPPTTVSIQADNQALNAEQRARLDIARDKAGRDRQLFDATYKINPQTGHLDYNEETSIGRAAKRYAETKGSGTKSQLNLITGSGGTSMSITDFIKNVSNPDKFMTIDRAIDKCNQQIQAKGVDKEYIVEKNREIQRLQELKNKGYTHVSISTNTKTNKTDFIEGYNMNEANEKIKNSFESNAQATEPDNPVTNFDIDELNG